MEDQKVRRDFRLERAQRTESMIAATEELPEGRGRLRQRFAGETSRKASTGPGLYFHRQSRRHRDAGRGVLAVALR
jgi:hypothetical protein